MTDDENFSHQKYLKIQLIYPINEETMENLTLIKGDTYNSVMLIVSDAQFDSTQDELNILVHLDNNEVTKYPYFVSGNGDESTIFIENVYVKDFVEHIKQAKLVKIECPLFNNGKNVFTFNPKGLEWNSNINL